MIINFDFCYDNVLKYFDIIDHLFYRYHIRYLYSVSHLVVLIFNVVLTYANKLLYFLRAYSTSVYRL